MTVPTETATHSDGSIVVQILCHRHVKLVVKLMIRDVRLLVAVVLGVQLNLVSVVAIQVYDMNQTIVRVKGIFIHLLQTA